MAEIGPLPTLGMSGSGLFNLPTSFTAVDGACWFAQRKLRVQNWLTRHNDVIHHVDIP